MSQVFIAYSRTNRDLALLLKKALEDAGKDVWIDLEDLPTASVWRLEIQEAIEGCISFVYLLSPESISSKYCQNEFKYARELNKKIIPILLPGTSDIDIPSEVSEIQWLRWEDFEKDLSNTEKLKEIIELDLTWVKFHAELTAKEKKWERTQDNNQLLRGKELMQAGTTLSKNVSVPSLALTDDQRKFILASQENEAKRKRRNKIIGGSILALVLGICCITVISGFYYFDHTPAIVEIGEQSQSISIRNRSKFRFVTIDVGSTISVYAEPQKLSKNGPYLIIVGTGPDGEHPGSVLAYDMWGNLKWKYSANDDPYDGPTANFSIRRILVDEIMGDGKWQIIFTSQKTDWYPSEIGLLNAEGKLLDSYWNSGFIYDVIPQDFNKDGVKELVISAVNNNLGYVVVNDPTKHPAIVYILSPEQGFTGQTFPDIIENRASGTEYNQWTAVLDPYAVPGIELRIVQKNGEDLIEVATKPVTGYIYLDSYGRIQQVGLSDSWQSERGNQSPADVICFLESRKDGWYFSEQVDQSEFCPWYVRE